ncbi:hypothetical protein [Ruminiclostridium cellulolyticum]|uniref:Uncharacterized protein n=1 Tax=Ruminiclostridium cellulolyticum (strain ATCC 35319 / DSM 5812 / JCM 6584 / H10) TaxID=394503 RepID=B8I2C8_RUMCH|nr:hypothetical protein [Ruminiclostridium cellulolyticum]ACL75921.1 hypothetical protein Ccel_1569 [Ruminiclostridium cellulolyticum H10]ACL75932.1 hypothetical protein Ccel_1580 [Ruminiclostridium cellulolyticum H10]ACL75943.1 hypothetical protein Ccel_1591 [Ruminiclostridium cellulolyticum H10]
MRKVSKKFVGTMVASLVVVSTCISIFAEDSDTVTAMGTAMSGVKSDGISALSTVAPYGIAIMGAFLIWKLGVKFFKSLAK